jgi:hypothetical protein
MGNLSLWGKGRERKTPSHPLGRIGLNLLKAFGYTTEDQKLVKFFFM